MIRVGKAKYLRWYDELHELGAASAKLEREGEPFLYDPTLGDEAEERDEPRRRSISVSAG